MDNPSLPQAVERVMKLYLEKYYGYSRVTVSTFGKGLQLRTTSLNKKSYYSINKFRFGLETVWLLMKQPNKPPIVLARLSQTKSHGVDFEVADLFYQAEAVKSQLPEMFQFVH